MTVLLAGGAITGAVLAATAGTAHAATTVVPNRPPPPGPQPPGFVPPFTAGQSVEVVSDTDLLNGPNGSKVVFKAGEETVGSSNLPAGTILDVTSNGAWDAQGFTAVQVSQGVFGWVRTSAVKRLG